MSIVAEDVTVIFKNKAVLRDVNLRLERGTYWLRGPNASGKTTLLKVLSFLLKPTKGRVVAFGKEDARGEVVYVPPSPVLLKGTVRDNLEFGVKIAKRGDPERVAEELGLLGLMDEEASKLSSGQAALVTLARALAVEPRAIMVDELLNYLDEENLKRALKAIERVEVAVIASHAPLPYRQIVVRDGKAYLRS